MWTVSLTLKINEAAYCDKKTPTCFDLHQIRLEFFNYEFRICLSSPAFTSPINSGCALFGRDLNSGWN